MLPDDQAQFDFDREIALIDEALSACKRDFEDLVYKRYEFIARRFGIDVMELIDYIIKSSDVPREAVDVILSIAMKKKTNTKR